MIASCRVWLDDRAFGPAIQVGNLFSVDGRIRFAYADGWLRSATAFAIDPELPVGRGDFYSDFENFGAFQDSSPDRWGRTLMKRREALAAKDEKRPAKTLYAWDYLTGVQDITRQGALRLAVDGDDNTYLANEVLSAPPLTSLKELAQIAYDLSNSKFDDQDTLRQWLKVLVAPGSSLGGARPKANFLEHDGSFWIAKFPSADDSYDVGAWEMVLHTLAETAGIQVPAAKLVKLNNRHHTFCSKRFDRTTDGRAFYASAMSLLKKQPGDDASYLDIAQIIQEQGAAGTIKRQLEQLYRRIAFNVLTANRDDHLRNHGFIRRPGGWTLTPAFDVNPDIEKSHHVLNIDGSDSRPQIESVLATAAWYDLDAGRAAAIVEEISSTVSRWQKVAASVGIAKSEIELLGQAFSVG